MRKKLNHWLWAAAVGVLSMMMAVQAVHAHEAPYRSGGKVELGASVAADSRGRLWMVSKQEQGDGKSLLVLRRSDDTGKSWTQPMPVTGEAAGARGEERPKIAAGLNDELYIVYTRAAPNPKLPHEGDVRLVRSLDGGKSFSAPVSVHTNNDAIVHAFGSIIVDPNGHVYAVWLDSRNRETARANKQPHRGISLYYAVSTDAGKTFSGDYRLADHSCECCRLGLALDAQQRPVVMWRHIFEPNVRDHAIAQLSVNGMAREIERASFDDWRIDACPHQGPSIAYAADGTRHQAWFTVKGDDAGIFYAAADKKGELGVPVRLGTNQAKQAEVAVRGAAVAVVWKQYDGESTALMARISADNGRTWTQKEVARTANDSDRPQLLHSASGLLAAWHIAGEGMRIISVVPVR